MLCSNHLKLFCIYVYIVYIYIYTYVFKSISTHIQLNKCFSFASNLIGSKHIAFFEGKKMRFLSSPCRWIETLAVLNLKWLAAQGSMIFIGLSYHVAILRFQRSF